MVDEEISYGLTIQKYEDCIYVCNFGNDVHVELSWSSNTYDKIRDYECDLRKHMFTIQMITEYCREDTVIVER